MTSAAPASPVSTARLGEAMGRRRGEILLDVAFSGVLFVGTFFGVLVLGLLLWTIFDKGWDRLAADPGAFLNNYVSRFPTRAGIKAALYGSAWLMGLTALFSFPVGFGAAIYLEEFANKGRLTTFKIGRAHV
jgi:phosphate transport system permease protein